MRRHFRTSESVTEGHPDKIADRISDAVLDEIISRDPQAHVACETFLTTGLVIVGGEISTSTFANIDQVARRVIADIGYDRPDLGFNYHDCAVLSTIKEQSPDIAAAVGKAAPDPYEAIGAGDQGIMFGYAVDETPELMPAPIEYAHWLAERLAAVRKNGTLEYLGPDGKTQVTVEYEGRKPVAVHRVLISAQHKPGVSQERLKDELTEAVVRPALDGSLNTGEFELLVNPSGRFEVGGPEADTGLTGRKIIVDTYGGAARHGGGSFSGKDPTKVDRSAAYAARYAAKNVVAAGLAEECEVQDRKSVV